MLGTVQLGLDYGIANAAGHPGPGKAFAILDAARVAGVSTLDTAHAYGNSESVIGAWLASRRPAMEVITKTPPLSGGDGDAARRALTESLKHLGVRRLAGLLMHRATDWTAPGMSAFIDGVLAHTARAAGVSIYSADEIPDDARIGLLQLPVNIFTQSIATAPAVTRLVADGCRIHVRSVLVQGLLLMPPERIPPRLVETVPAVARLQAMAREAGCTTTALAIACVKSLLPIAELVLGADDPGQPCELAAACTTRVPPAAVEAALALGRSLPERLFDPRFWPEAR